MKFHTTSTIDDFANCRHQKQPTHMNIYSTPSQNYPPESERTTPIVANPGAHGRAKDMFWEFEHLWRKHLRPMNNRLTEELKLQYFQSLLREESIEFYHSHNITTETTMNQPYISPTIKEKSWLFKIKCRKLKKMILQNNAFSCFIFREHNMFHCDAFFDTQKRQIGYGYVISNLIKYKMAGVSDKLQTIVVSVTWASVCSLTLRDTRFRMKITLGVVLIRSLVCT